MDYYLGLNLTCLVSSLRNGELPAKDCLLPLISKLLSYFLIALSTTVKLPQIKKIFDNKSVKGLSVVAFELEVVGFTISLAYCIHKELPFSAYGEIVSILIQALILVACIYYFSRPLSVTTWVRVILYCSLAPTLFSGKIGPLVFEALYASKHLVFLSARLPQIWKNFRNKSTGQLSFLTCLMNLGGSIARVFTLVQANSPNSMLMGISLAISTNAIIMSQILLYRGKGKEEKQVKVTKVS